MSDDPFEEHYASLPDYTYNLLCTTEGCPAAAMTEPTRFTTKAEPGAIFCGDCSQPFTTITEVARSEP